MIYHFIDLFIDCDDEDSRVLWNVGSLRFYRTTWRQIFGDSSLHSDHLENLKSQSVM
jgi:hypothetical protein